MNESVVKAEDVKNLPAYNRNYYFRWTHWLIPVPNYAVTDTAPLPAPCKLTLDTPRVPDTLSKAIFGLPGRSEQSD